MTSRVFAALRRAAHLSRRPDAGMFMSNDTLSRPNTASSAPTIDVINQEVEEMELEDDAEDRAIARARARVSTCQPW